MGKMILKIAEVWHSQYWQKYCIHQDSWSWKSWVIVIQAFISKALICPGITWGFPALTCLAEVDVSLAFMSRDIAISKIFFWFCRTSISAKVVFSFADNSAADFSNSLCFSFCFWRNFFWARWFLALVRSARALASRSPLLVSPLDAPGSCPARTPFVHCCCCCCCCCISVLC